MHHFFVKEDQIGEETIAITGPDVNHMKNVLRMKCGDRILVSSGLDQDYICQVAQLGPEQVVASILSMEEGGSELPARLYLFQGLPKGDKMDQVVQKAVELGAFQVIPVAASRSVVKLDPKKAAAKVNRWNAIAQSAAKQSMRGIIPQVAPVMDFPQALAYGRDLDLLLMPYELEEGMEKTRDAFGRVKPGSQVGIFIGPEGGFEEREVALARSYGAMPLTLGRRILRTETAGLAVLAALMFQLEERT